MMSLAHSGTREKLPSLNKRWLGANIVGVSYVSRSHEYHSHFVVPGDDVNCWQADSQSLLLPVEQVLPLGSF